MSYIFISDAERVWIRIKETANDLQSSGEKLNFDRALAVVRAIIRQEHAVSVPEDAREYFAAELQRMTEEQRVG